tara:strand:+ start:2071 stop:2541 length:471 start_codon:yes stop_codon:yes gene_type:complete
MLEKIEPNLALEYETFDDHLLLAIRISAEEQEKLHRERRDRADFEIQRRIDARGATGLPDEEFVCEVRYRNPSPVYDPDRLKPLLEIITVEADLEKCYTAAHDEHEVIHYPEVWQAAPLKKVAMLYGDRAMAVLELARNPGRPYVVVERRKVPDAH